MVSFKHFDLCIGEALEQLQSAMAEVVKFKGEIKNSKEILTKTSSAMLEIWAARDIFYADNPECKRDFKREFEEDGKRYEELSEIQNRAVKFEEEGKFKEAGEIYKELLEISKYGFFKLVAQAGLYRCNQDKI